MSKLDALREQNPELNKSIFDIIKNVDPSGTYRYASFLVKMMKNRCNSDNLLKIMTGIDMSELHEYHKLFEQKLIEDTDILTYTKEKFKKQLAIGREKFKLKEAEKQVTKLFTDETWEVLIPESFEAGQVYGKNTQWCITQKIHWDNYVHDTNFIYIINKVDNTKFCISKNKHRKQFQVWAANDAEIDILDLPVTSEIFGIILTHLRDEKKNTVDKYWKTALGDTILIDDMEISHLRNTIKMYEKGRLKESAAPKIQYMRKVLKTKVQDEKEECESERLLEWKTTVDSLLSNNDYYNELYGTFPPPEEHDNLPF